MGKIKKIPIQDFHRFRYKNLLNLFFEVISHNYQLFSHIIVWFYNIFMILNWNSEKQILKISWKFQFSSKFSVFKIDDSLHFMS